VITNFGLTFHIDASSRPHFWQVPGFELSIQISARAISFRKILAATRLRQIQRDAENIAAFLDPGRRDVRLAVPGREPDADIAPSDVADSGALDLDNFRAHFGRQFRGERLRNQGPGRYDFHALKWAELFSDEIFDAHGLAMMPGFCKEGQYRGAAY